MIRDGINLRAWLVADIKMVQGADLTLLLEPEAMDGNET
jgi:hypothetical protein